MRTLRLVALTLAGIAAAIVLACGSFFAFSVVYMAGFLLFNFPASPHRWELIPFAIVGLVFATCLWLLPALYLRLKNPRPQLKCLIAGAWLLQLFLVCWYMVGAKEYSPIFFNAVQQRYSTK